MAYTAFTTGTEAVKALPTEAGFKFYIVPDTALSKGEQRRIAKDRAFEFLTEAPAKWGFQVTVLKSEKKVVIVEDRKR